MDTPDLTTYEDDGCACKFRYGSDGSFSVLYVCGYHERLLDSANEAGMVEQAERCNQDSMFQCKTCGPDLRRLVDQATQSSSGSNGTDG